RSARRRTRTNSCWRSSKPSTTWQPISLTGTAPRSSARTDPAAKTEPLKSRDRKETAMAVDDKIVIGQTHGADDPEAVLIGYVMGSWAVRAGELEVMWMYRTA